MTHATLLSKVTALPAHLQAEVADFVDFLLHKSTSSKVAALTSKDAPPVSLERGAGKHLIAYMAEDFDAPSDDFADYM